MNYPAWLDHELCVRCVQTLGHFLWQGCVIAALVAGINGLVRQSARVRYLASFTGLLLMVASVAITFGILGASGENAGRPVPPVAPNGDVTAVGVGLDVGDPGQASNPPDVREMSPDTEGGRAVSALPLSSWWCTFSQFIIAMYVLGAAAMLIRLIVALRGGQRLKRSSRSLDDPALLDLLACRARQLGLRTVPRVYVCGRIAVPIIVGILKPVVLIPISIMNQLSMAQVEAILTHEMSHIRRLDHLMNLVQRIIESLLFFHPAVWYVGRSVSRERENCCDDMVVANGTSAVSYADVLVRVSELGQSNLKPGAAALAVSGSGSSMLRERVLRLLGYAADSPFRLSRAVLATGAVLAVALAGILFANVQALASKDSPEPDGSAREPEDSASGDSESLPRVVSQWQSDVYHKLTQGADSEMGYLNLGTGKYIKPSDRRRDAIVREFSDLKIDLFFSPLFEKCVSRDMVTIKVKDGWSLSPPAVIELLDEALSSPGEHERNAEKIGTLLEPNTTYAFETREGVRGILELLPDPKDTSVKTVRYSLLEVVAVPDVKLADGVYRVDLNKQVDGAGVRVLRSDTTDSTVVLGDRLTDRFGEVTMASISNDNSRFRINLKSVGPFPEGADVGHFALVIDNVCVMVGGNSDMDAEGKMDLGAWGANRAAVDKIAKRLKVVPRLRIHPGHEIETQFSPSKESFSLDEPIVLQMRVKNSGERPFTFYDGGRQRGVRNNQFSFSALGDAGKGAELPVIEATDFGGIAAIRTLEPGEVFTKDVDITKWFDFKRPGKFLIRGSFEMEFHDADDEDYWVEWDETARGECVVTILD